MQLTCGAGCCRNRRTQITAIPLSIQNADEPPGIPFYLPKPLLIVSKNFHYVEESQVGLTKSANIPGTFDDQSKYADVNSRANFAATGGGGDGDGGPDAGEPSTIAGPAPVLHSDGAPTVPGDSVVSDGLLPETFHTFQILFVPDLTQKYGLTVKGGAGEIRAAMNIVNGWQFTGLGPYYMKDSSTAQNVLAAGITSNLVASGAADVISSFGDLRRSSIDGSPISRADLERVNAQINLAKQRATTVMGRPGVVEGYAEIHVYQPQLLPDGSTQWHEIPEMSRAYSRKYLGYSSTDLSRFRQNLGAASGAGVPANLLDPGRLDGSRSGAPPGRSNALEQDFLDELERRREDDDPVTPTVTQNLIERTLFPTPDPQCEKPSLLNRVKRALGCYQGKVVSRNVIGASVVPANPLSRERRDAASRVNADAMLRGFLPPAQGSGMPARGADRATENPLGEPPSGGDLPAPVPPQ